MALRLYLWNSNAPYTPATVRGAWDATASAVAKALYPAGKSPAQTMTSIGVAETSTTDNWDVLLGRFISPPLDAQTISGTLTGYLVAWESSSSANDLLHIHLYVTQGDSDTVRGTLLTDYVTASEFNTVRRGISIGSQALSSVAASAGDRLVLEVGYRANNTSATSYTGSIVYGALSTNPDASDETTTFTTDANSAIPWIEFSSLSMTLAGQLQVSQLAVEASNYDTATGVQLQVSQLATEASSIGGTTTARVSQVNADAATTLASPTVRVSQVAVDAASYTAPVVVSPSTAELAISGEQPSVSVSSALAPTQGELVLEGNQPSVIVDQVLSPQAGTLIFLGNQPVAPAITPQAGELVLTGDQPQVTVGQAAWPGSGVLLLQGNTAIQLVPHVIQPSSGVLVLTGGSPEVRLYPLGRLVFQLVVEATSLATATGEISQLAAEAVSISPPSTPHVSQVTAEGVSRSSGVLSRVGQVVVEAVIGKTVWVDVADFVVVVLPSTAFPSKVGVVQLHLWSSSPTATIRARLFDITANTSAGESATVQATAPTRCTFGATISEGANRYKLQITANESHVDLFAIGYIRPQDYMGEVGGGEEPVPPDPPYQPSWWLPWGSGIALPESKGTFHYGSGSFNAYRWTGITAVVDGYESTMAFGGDLHGNVDPNIGAMIEWSGVPGATAYRVYVFNALNDSGLFDPHVNTTNLRSGDAGPVVIQFKEVPATPNWGGWPPESEWEPDPPPEYECAFLGDTDGTTWTKWP